MTGRVLPRQSAVVREPARKQRGNDPMNAPAPFRRSARILGGLAALSLLAACSGTAAPGPTPPGMQVVGYGYTCKAGIYTCKMPTQVPLGNPCSCPGIGAASYGNIHQP
ncbi:MULTISPECIES: hypothetical protein [unclassified Asaia]|uniref:hypothetical protein n=1 Tax=unclassified Asaia TaxID=2685023 RepID=UPI001F1761F6|nr:hypothetical protein [Asaia sp. W19]